MREAADDELQSGKRGAKIAGDNTTPYSLAQYLAIRDSFADQWQPQGGIESAMVEMLSISYSLQMYWSTVAHDRATRAHDPQREQVSASNRVAGNHSTNLKPMQWIRRTDWQIVTTRVAAAKRLETVCTRCNSKRPPS